MEVSSRFVGTPLKEYRTEVVWRDVMNYAAAVGDANPRYFDDERPEGIVAHPLFCVALTWPILGQIWDFLEAGDFPFHLLATQVHYTEHLAFFGPIRPGIRLAISGQITAILPHRSGTEVIIRLDAWDAEGAAIFTEHTGALLRGVRCADEGRGSETLPTVPAASGPGRPIWEVAIPVDPLQSYLYDGCTGITFPIHTSRQFARQIGLPGIILQGTATLALAVRELVNREAGGDPGRLGSLYARFTAMVRPGTQIRMQLTGRVPGDSGVDSHFCVVNEAGRTAISDGHAFLKGREEV